MNDLLILATLLPGPKHGYQLKHEAGLIVGQQVLHNNLVYPLLRRFMKNKWVSRKAVPGERGQTRHRYALTVLGRKELVAKLSSFGDQDARSAESFRIRVGMFHLLKPEVRRRILHARQGFLRARIAKLTAVEKSFELDRYAGEVITHFRAETQLELDWIGHVHKLDKSVKEID